MFCSFEQSVFGFILGRLVDGASGRTLMGNGRAEGAKLGAERAWVHHPPTAKLPAVNRAWIHHPCMLYLNTYLIIKSPNTNHQVLSLSPCLVDEHVNHAPLPDFLPDFNLGLVSYEPQSLPGWWACQIPLRREQDYQSFFLKAIGKKFGRHVLMEKERTSRC